ncbi:hypothetical protein Spb1_38400 [Planctopirus ephydatiae]|uniref:Uncharacterized protein n=1 Tax=Planctopirus ephydatiae TaxID=2528019 RepID=A0A518GTI1_9PLAN|nr:hypothetical protein Spb1_38400 [Planctopirus ephydatiae]
MVLVGVRTIGGGSQAVFEVLPGAVVVEVAGFGEGAARVFLLDDLELSAVVGVGADSFQDAGDFFLEFDESVPGVVGGEVFLAGILSLGMVVMFPAG